MTPNPPRSYFVLMQKTWADAMELANAMEERALTGREVRLSSATALWMARQIQNAIARQHIPARPKSKFDIDLYDSGSCVMKVDAGGDIVEIVAWARNSLAAQAAFEEICSREPNYSFHQRRRAWVENERMVKR